MSILILGNNENLPYNSLWVPPSQTINCSHTLFLQTEVTPRMSYLKQKDQNILVINKGNGVQTISLISLSSESISLCVCLFPLAIIERNWYAC